MMVPCRNCGHNHRLNAAQMAILLERMQDGNGHVVTTRVPYNSRVRTQIVPRCLLKVAGIVAITAGGKKWSDV